ncbi:hypothetical protein FLL78_21310, partial [Vibrio cholerae]
PEISSAIEALQAEFTRLKRQYANTPYPSLTHRLQRFTQHDVIHAAREIRIVSDDHWRFAPQL